MKIIILLIVLIVGNSSFLKAQTKTSYYKGKYFSKHTKPEKAKYIKVQSFEKGQKIVEYRNVKSNTTIRKHFASGEQTGIWTTREGKVLDYNFKIVYSSQRCFDTIPTEKLDPIRQKNLKAKMLDFLAHNVDYPRHAREYGISGIVRTTVTFEPNGKLKMVTVKEAPHLSLAKESVRAIKDFFSQNPYPFKSTSSYCMELPVAFEMD